MIQNLKLARGTPFLAFNAAAMLFVVIFLLAPIMAHFADRGEEISDNAAQLAHFQNVARAAKKSVGSVGQVRRSLPSRQRRTRRQRRSAGQPEVDGGECRRQSARDPRLAGRAVPAVADDCRQRRARRAAEGDPGHDPGDREPDAVVVCLHGRVPKPGGRRRRSRSGPSSGFRALSAAVRSPAEISRPWMANKPVPVRTRRSGCHDLVGANGPASAVGHGEFAAAIRGLPACRHARPDRSAQPKRTGGAAACDAGSHRWDLRPGSRWSAR